MKLIVGLGNPGAKYQHTRHNVGFMVVGEIAGNSEWTESKSSKAFYTWIDLGGEVELFTPQTFMNKSGTAVAKAVKKHPNLTNNDIYVIHDDLDIPLGKFKIHFGRGPKDHKGIKSIETSLGSPSFWRVRIGVDNRVGGQAEINGEEYVLKPFNPKEKEIISQVIKQVIAGLTKRLYEQEKN